MLRDNLSTNSRKTPNEIFDNAASKSNFSEGADIFQAPGRSLSVFFLRVLKVSIFQTPQKKKQSSKLHAQEEESDHEHGHDER